VDVLIGADIGQRHDPTAICVAELEWRDGSRAGRDDHYVIRYLGRLQLGTAYPDVVAELVRIRAAILARPVEQPAEVVGAAGTAGIEIHRERRPSRPNVTLYVDATGVGQPVVDLLDAAGAHPTACYFTYGERRTQQGREVRLGKAWMVSRLQALAQTGRIHLPRTKEAEATRAELLEYEIRVSEDGSDSFGAFRTGKHDDLVTALGLATQATPRSVYVY
jgi:hypothetical protein